MKTFTTLATLIGGLLIVCPCLAAVGLGELAFIGLDVIEDDFAMVALADIQANETIYFTDRDLTTGFVPEDIGLESKEGTVEWVTAQLIPAGQVLLFDGMRGSNRSVRLSDGVEVGQMTEIGDFDLAGNIREELYVYQGAADVPTGYVTAWYSNDTDNEGDSHTDGSVLDGQIADATGLLLGSTAINTGRIENVPENNPNNFASPNDDGQSIFGGGPAPNGSLYVGPRVLPAGSTLADFLPLINSLGPLNPYWAVDPEDPENGAFFGDNFDQATSFSISSNLPGDYTGDGFVDSADYTLWSRQYGQAGFPAADGNFDGRVSAADYTVWRDNAPPAAQTTSVPESSCLVSLISFGVVRMASRNSPV